MTCVACDSICAAVILSFSFGVYERICFAGMNLLKKTNKKRGLTCEQLKPWPAGRSCSKGE